MDAKLVLPTLLSAGSGFSDFREALESMHSMIGAQFRSMAATQVPAKLTEHGFQLISDSLMDLLGNAQSELALAVRLIEAMEQEENKPGSVLSLSSVADLGSRGSISGAPAIDATSRMRSVRGVASPRGSVHLACRIMHPALC